MIAVIAVIAVSLNVGGTVHVHAKHYKHKEDGRTAQGVCGNGSTEPLGERRYENWNTQTHTHFKDSFLIFQ